jgi:O-antigen/teichoic acid export membrane protein
MLILFPLILSTEQIGLYKVLLDTSLLLMIFSLLGTMETSIKYFPFFKNQEKEHGGFLSYILIIALSGFVFFTSMFLLFNDQLIQLFVEKSALLVDYRYFIIPLSFILVLYNVFGTYSRSLFRIVMPKFFKEVLIRSLLAISLILLMFGLYEFDGFVLSMVIAYAIALTLLILYIGNLGHLFLRPNLAVFRSDKRKEMGTFFTYSLLTSGSGILVAKIDTIMITAMVGLSGTGVYGIAYFISAVVQLPRRTLSEIVTPLIAAAFKAKRMDKIQELYQKTSVTLIIIGGFAFTGIWINIDSIFALIPNSESFIAGKYVVLMIGLSNLFDMSLGTSTPIITNSKYFRWNLLFLPTLAVITITTNYILIPKYGILGAAAATFISLTSINTLRYFFVLIKLKLQPFNFQTMKGLFIVGLVFATASYIPSFDNVFIDIALRSGVIVIMYLGLNLWLKPSEDINNLLNKGISMVTNRNTN